MKRHVKASSAGSNLGCGKDFISPNRRFAFIPLLALLCVLAIDASPAFARVVHVVGSSFGSAGSGAGQLSLRQPNFEAEPRMAGSNLAVNDTSGEVYVADTNNHRVSVFSAGGSFIRAFGADVGGAGVDVCTASCVAATPGSEPGAFEDPAFVAVDNTAGPSSGDVYVADTAANRVSKFQADGTLISSWGTGGQLSSFTQIGGIAVDAEGRLDVFEVEPHALIRFNEDGSPSAEFETFRGSSPGGFAVDPDGNFFKINGDSSAEKLNSTGGGIGQVSGGDGTTGRGLAADPITGDLYVATPEGAIKRYEFDPSGQVIQEDDSLCTMGEFAGCLPSESLQPEVLRPLAGLAVNSSHTVYAANVGDSQVMVFDAVLLPDATTEAANPVGASSATLHGTVSAAGGSDASCEFQYTTDAAFKANGFVGAASVPCSPAGPFSGSSSEAVSATVNGLTPGTTYGFRLLATNEDGSTPGKALSFLTLGPSISGESVSSVSTDSALISGLVNPRGKTTQFVVQYVSDADFQQSGYANAISVPAPPEEIGSGKGFVEVAQEINGLAPETAYHFRLVATNADATTPGTGGLFTTFPLTAAGLPDGRVYEMVSPSRKIGEVFPLEPVGDLSGSCNGCLPGLTSRIFPMQSAPDGESIAFSGQPFTENLASGQNQYVGQRGAGGWSSQSFSPPQFSSGQVFEAFSPDLSRTLVLSEGLALSPLAPSSGGLAYRNLYLREEGGSFTPLITDPPPNRLADGAEGDRFEIEFSGANSGISSSTALGHVIFNANDALTAAVPGIAPAAPEIGGNERNLYEWDNGQLELVNVLPGNFAEGSGAVFGSGNLINGPSQSEFPAIEHAISNSGARIFWTDTEDGHLYVRENGSSTVQVPDAGSCTFAVEQANRACFLTAAADGSRVLFNDGHLYNVDNLAQPPADLTDGEGGFKGILGASEDLSRVFFVDTKALTPLGEENENGEHAEGGAFNLYAWQEGATAFVGRLLEGDNRTSGGGLVAGDWRLIGANRTAQVTPDGRYVTFMSRASLTGYDNTGPCASAVGNIVIPGPCREVFEYDADAGKLSCASCNPSGEQPLGQSTLSLIKPVPGLSTLRQPGNLSTDGHGRLFFESLDTLSPNDHNGRIQDVYEWEPNGVGSCKRPEGCVSLISSGNSPNDSFFVDSTPSGNDAFIITREQLLLRDKDEQLDLYDARVGGGIAENFPEPCLGEACKGPATSAPEQSGAGSSTFSGPGNEKPKKAKKNKKHKKKHHKHKSKAHKRSAKHNSGGSK